MSERGTHGRRISEQDATPVVPGLARSHTYDGATFASERDLLVRFLDDFRAAESFGAEVLTLWAEVAGEAIVRGGLRTIAARERCHGELLESRLREIGGECRADLSPYLKEAARSRLASADVSDADKLQDVLARYSDVDAAVRPIREILAQIHDDLETKGLLATMLDDEMATLNWMAVTWRSLVTVSAPSAGGKLPAR